MKYIIKNTGLQKNGHLKPPPRESFSRFSQNRITAHFSEKSYTMLPAPFLHFMTVFSRFLADHFTLCFLGYAKNLKWLQLFMEGPKRYMTPIIPNTTNLNTQEVAMNNKAELQILLFHS